MRLDIRYKALFKAHIILKKPILLDISMQKLPKLMLIFWLKFFKIFIGIIGLLITILILNLAYIFVTCLFIFINNGNIKSVAELLNIWLQYYL